MAVVAKIYSPLEIRSSIENQKNLDAAHVFIKQYFTASKPKDFIDEHINKIKNPIILEYQLYVLLDEISLQSKQKFLNSFIRSMKIYQPQAMMWHKEGRMKIPVYDIQSKAKGIENIWLAAESLNNYVQLFDADPIQTLELLKNNIHLLSQPQWYGLKNSIYQISSDNQKIISTFLLENSTNLIGLDKFIGRYALIVKSKELSAAGIQFLDKANREYLLRYISDYFEEDFVVEQLFNAVKNSPSQSFAMTLLKPYAEDNAEVQQYLIQSLKNKNVSMQAAFVVSGIKNIEVLNELEENYYNSTSKLEQKSILLTLKLSHQEYSKIVLKRIEHQNSIIDDNGRI